MVSPDSYLTKEEVDALLAIGEQTGVARAPAPDVTVFDFRRPEKMSKEQEESLKVMQADFAHHMAGTLSTFMRTVVRANLASCGEMLYETFMANVPTGWLMAICSAPPLEGKMVVVMDPSLCLSFIDRLMGGPGDPPPQERALTEIEMILIRRVLDRIFVSMREAWAKVVDIKPAIDQLETAPHFMQVVPGPESVVVVSVSVSQRTANGRMELCLPYRMLKPILPRLHQNLWFHDVDKEQGDRPLPEVCEHLLQTPVRVSAELGEASISVADLLDLQVGDCVVLNTRESDELPVLVAGNLCLRGTLGVSNNNYAVAITRWEERSAESLQPSVGGDE